MKQYASSVPKLAVELGVAYEKLRKEYMADDRFPQKTGKGWSTAHCAEFCAMLDDERARSTRGPNADLAREILEIRRDTMRLKYEEAAGLVVTRDDVKRTIGELVASFRHALENRVQQVASETDDPDRLAAEEDLRDKTLQWAQERIEG